MVGGDEALVKDLLLGFRDEMDSLQSDIETHIKANRLKEAGDLLHRVKGTAGNLGAKGLREIVVTLESALKRNELDSSAYDEFKKVFRQLKTVLMNLG